MRNMKLRSASMVARSVGSGKVAFSPVIPDTVSLASASSVCKRCVKSFLKYSRSFFFMAQPAQDGKKFFIMGLIVCKGKNLAGCARAAAPITGLFTFSSNPFLPVMPSKVGAIRLPLVPHKEGTLADCLASCNAVNQLAILSWR
jgi:hypothetical protein